MFDVLVDGNDITRSKPDPEVFLLAAERLGVIPEDCLVVEDAPNGIAAARAAGARCLGLTTSFSREDLAGADWLAPTLAGASDEVLDW